VLQDAGWGVTEPTQPADFMIGDYMPISRGGWWVNRLDLNYAARWLEISGEYLDKRFTLIFEDFR
jgi:hypothetical protein